MTKLFWFIFLFGNLLLGQTFTASVDRTTVGENGRFQVYFEFSGGNANDLDKFLPPDFQGFKILGGPNRSSSMQIINGRVSSSLTFSYIILALKEGSYTIGSASVEYNGKRLSTNPITITVTKGDSQSGQGGISDQQLSENLFILAIPNKNSVYQGEQVNITYKLYTRLNISSPEISKLPSYNGFWSQEIESPQTINYKTEIFKGKQFNVAEIKKVALFPTRSGKLEVTPFELNIPVLIKKQRTNSRDIFDDFFNDPFFNRTEKIDFTAASNKIFIDVKPLPESGKPENFNGAVGNFDFNWSLDKTESQANEPITFKFTVTGSGNINLLDLPKLNLPNGFEVYDPKISENVNKGNIISGSKTIEYLIVPRVAGKKVIPSVSFSFFNPSTNSYKTISSDNFELDILRGKDGFVNTTEGLTKEEIELLNKDIRFIKLTSNLYNKSMGALIPEWFWFSLIIPFLVMLIYLGIAKRNQNISTDIKLLKYKKAEKEAKAKLKVAKTALENSDSQKFYNEISNALTLYLQNKLSLNQSDFNEETVSIKLIKVGIEQEKTDEVIEILRKCEFARFAPSNNPNADIEFYNKTLKIIIELENKIKLR